MVTTFSMPSTGSAVVYAGSLIVPWRDRMQVQWRDEPSGTVFLSIVHDSAETDTVTSTLLNAHPRVRLVSTVPA